MARPIFPATNDSLVLAVGGYPQAGIPVRIYSRQTGGTQITDLTFVDVDSITPTTAVPAGVLTSDGNGMIPTFAGPDGGASTVWADHGMTSNRMALTASGGGGGGGAVSSVVGQAGAVTGAQIAADAALTGMFAQRWQANTAYASGQVVVLPDGSVGTAKTGFTSGASYDAADWDIPATSSAGFDGGSF